MPIKHFTLSTALIATVLLLIACNPIPAQPSPLTSVPTPLPTPVPEPMQASLYDFAFALSALDSAGLDLELYVTAILKIRDCMEAENLEWDETPNTPGQTAALQWSSILIMITLRDLENFKPDTPNVYNNLMWLHEYCMGDH